MYDLIQIGKTKKTVGYQGKIRIELDDRYFEDLRNASAVFIEYGYEKIPFFISTFDTTEDLIQFDDILNREEASKLTGKSIYLRRSDIKSKQPLDNSLHRNLDELIGWRILDSSHGEVGVIDRIEAFPQQNMAIVTMENREVMIPLHQDLIDEIIEEDKKIIMSLPAGILEIGKKKDA